MGNHLHFQIQIKNRRTYNPFIRAITSAIAMAVSGASRWTKSTLGKFWDYRPFTRVVIGRNAVFKLREYILLNEFEGSGVSRFEARQIIEKSKRRWGRNKNRLI